MYSFPIFLLFWITLWKMSFSGEEGSRYVSGRMDQIWIDLSPVTFFLTFVTLCLRPHGPNFNLSPVNDLFSWPFVIQWVTGTCPIPVLKQHIWFSYVTIRGLVFYYPQTLNYLLQIIAILFTEHTASTIGWFWLCSYHDSGAPNDGFLPNTMNTLFRLYRVPLHL